MHSVQYTVRSWGGGERSRKGAKTNSLLGKQMGKYIDGSFTSICAASLDICEQFSSGSFLHTCFLKDISRVERQKKLAASREKGR